MRQAAAVLALLAAAGVGPAEKPDRGQQLRPLVGAYYYPWYYPDRWTKEPVTHTPQLGRYSSAERTVAKRHIEWAKQAGLDFFLVSWLSAGGREDRNLKRALLPELGEGRFRFALLYETPLALNLPAGKPIDLDQKLPGGMRAGEQLVKHFEYLADTYLEHESYLKFKGKAVVVVYLVRDMANAGPYLRRVRERLRQRGVELYLIADAVYWEPAERLDWKFLKEHFQAVTAYNMYHRPEFLKRVGEQYRAGDRLARGHGLRFIPGVMPGYDDTPLRGTDRVTIGRRRGRFYRDYWDVAARFVRPDQPFLLVTSFNEWHEGTELEPSAEYGDRYIRLTRELIGRVGREVPPR